MYSTKIKTLFPLTKWLTDPFTLATLAIYVLALIGLFSAVGTWFTIHRTSPRTATWSDVGECHCRARDAGNSARGVVGKDAQSGGTASDSCLDQRSSLDDNSQDRSGMRTSLITAPSPRPRGRHWRSRAARSAPWTGLRALSERAQQRQGGECVCRNLPSPHLV
jgi:hypothetical protein